MSQIVLKENLFSPEIREVLAPESGVRECTQVHTADPAYDFYDELTEPMWNPPLLQPVYVETPQAAPHEEVEVKVAESDVEQPHAMAPLPQSTLHLSLWQRWRGALARSIARLLPKVQRTAL